MGQVTDEFLELQTQYSNYKNALQQLAQKIGDVEQEAEEHKFVLLFAFPGYLLHYGVCKDLSPAPVKGLPLVYLTKGTSPLPILIPFQGISHPLRTLN
jgi:hypothetical protein